MQNGNSDELERLVGRLATWATAQPEIKRLYLFGIRMRGDARPESDLDIAIELDLAALPGVDESGGLATWLAELKPRWQEQIRNMSPFTVDLQRLGQDTRRMREYVAHSSRLVYEKQ